MNKIFFKIIIILLIIESSQGFAFERVISLKVPIDCSICKIRNTKVKNGYGEFEWGSKRWSLSYQGNFQNHYINGLGELRFINRGDIYIGQFAMNSIQGFGEYIWQDGDRYIGYFEDDFLEGNGIYINKQWIINATFEKDKPLVKNKFYACNRVNGYIYKTKERKLGLRYDNITISPNNLVRNLYINHKKIIERVKSQLSELYYYKGPINNKCNGGFFDSIKEFMEDNNLPISALSSDFFINVINSEGFSQTLTRALERIN